MSYKLKPGDHVMLRNGGPVMEVTRYVADGVSGKTIVDPRVECTWYDPRQGWMKDVFYQTDLEPATLLSGQALISDTGKSSIYGAFKRALKTLTQREARSTFVQLAEALSFLNMYDYTTEFSVMEEHIISLKDEKKYRPEEMTVIRVFHFEGLANLDDMAVLYVLKADDGNKGWVANAKGVHASSDLERLLPDMKLIDRQFDSMSESQAGKTNQLPDGKPGI